MWAFRISSNSFFDNAKLPRVVLRTEIKIFYFGQLWLSPRGQMRGTTLFAGKVFILLLILSVVAAYDRRPESYKLGIFTWRTKIAKTKCDIL